MARELPPTSDRSSEFLAPQPSDSRRRLHRFALPLILLLAFGLRLFVALDTPLEPRWQNLQDASWYDARARELALGQGYVERDGEPTAKWPPGYPLLLAAVYRLAGPAVLHAKLLNVFLATATCFMTFAIGRMAYGVPIGLMAALFVAMSPGDVFYAPITMSEVAFQFAFTLLVYGFLRLNQGVVGVAGLRWGLLGLLTGAAALIRGPGVFFLPVPIAAWWLASLPRRTLLLRGLFLFAGIALALTPWTLRNQRAFGSPIVLSTNGAWVLFDSHSPVATGSHTRRAGQFRRAQFKELDALGPRERVAARSQAEVRAALRYAAAHPVEELILAPQRLYHLFAGDDFGVRTSQRAFQLRDDSFAPETVRRYDRLALVANAYFVVLTVVALIGFTRVWSRGTRHAVAIPIVLLVFVTMHTFVFLGGPRFHAPFVPLLAILAAVAVAGRRVPWPLEGAPVHGKAGGAA